VETTLPKRPCARLRPIEFLDIALAKVFHDSRYGIEPPRCHQKMHMIGHQHIRVDIAFLFASYVLENREIAVVGHDTIEAATAVHASLHDVDG
jgi:hypothetical protein